MLRNTTAGLTSVIIPALCEASAINAVVTNVREAAGGLPVEIIVADGDPDGSTLAAIADPEVVGIISSPGRGAQMNAGAEAASGDVLLFLHADTRLPGNGLRHVRKAMHEHQAGAFRVCYDTRSRWVRFLGEMSNLRARMERIPYGDQTHFFRAETFHSLGGYPEIPIMEDVEMFQKLAASGVRPVLLRERVTTSARRYEAEGVFARPFRNIGLRLRHRFGADPRSLAGSYRPQCHLERK